MKNILATIIILILIHISFGFEKDSISLKLVTDTLYGAINDTIYCKITNKSNDTLVFINEFYPDGLADSIILGYPMGYAPNIMFFVKVGNYTPLGDGRYKTSYYNFPKFGIINPYSEITIKVTYKNKHPLMAMFNWRLSCVMHVTKKITLDAIVNKYYKNRINEYLNSFQLSNSFISELMVELPPESSSEDKTLDKIKNAFDIDIKDLRF